MKRFAIVSVLLLALAGCGGGTPVSTEVPFVQNNPIDWRRSASTIVYRMEVQGGRLNAFLQRGELPLCTIFGDNRIVWVNELDANVTEVLEDRLSDAQIIDFLNFALVQSQLLNYNAGLDLQIPGDETPTVEVITLEVNNFRHVTDGFGGWPPGLYEELLARCRSLSQAPVQVLPTAAWITAREVPYDSSAPGTPWSAEASGLNLRELAASGERRWLADRNVPILWNVLRNAPANIQFFQDNVPYEVVLEVPGLQRDAPPPP